MVILMLDLFMQQRTALRTTLLDQHVQLTHDGHLKVVGSLRLNTCTGLSSLPEHLEGHHDHGSGDAKKNAEHSHGE